jgi:DNA-binding GntR family transcriptional regulator
MVFVRTNLRYCLPIRRINMPRPAPRQSLCEQLAAQIRNAIVDARFAFGEALSEENLAEAFEVSRTPVRQALGLLQMEELVVVVPKSGTYVFTPTLEDISELCDYRAGLELQAARLACRNSGPELARALAELVEGMQEACSREDMQQYGRLDTQYHLALFERCDNRYLERGYRLILGRVAALRTQLAVRAEGEPDRSLADHLQLIELIKADRGDEVETVLFDHIQRTKDNYLAAFAKHSSASQTGLSQLRGKLGL